MRRRAIMPFFVEDKKISSLNDLKEILSKNPTALIVPLQDGRLERFLKGISDSYLQYLNPKEPKETLNKLAESLGVEIKDEIDAETLSSLVSSADELIDLINKNNVVNLPKGVLEIEELILSKPVRLIGQGKNDTHIKVKKLILKSSGVIFENLTCEVGIHDFLSEEIEVKNGYLNLKDYIEYGMEYIVNLTSETKIIEINEPITLKDKEVIYENVKFIIRNNGKIDMENCQCNIKNCSFVYEEKNSEEESILQYHGNSSVDIENCFFKNCGVEVRDFANLKVRQSQFSDGSALGFGGNSIGNVAESKFIKNQFGIFLAENSHVTISNSLFEENIGEEAGFGILATGKSNLNVSESKFIKNQFGMFLAENSSATISNSLFEENGSNEKGSGIAAEGKSNLEISESKFIRNVYGILLAENSHVTISNSLFEENIGEEVGFGIGAADESNLEISESKFIKNQFGMSLAENSRATVSNSIFEENIAIGIFAKDESNFQISESKFIKNAVGIGLIENAHATVSNSLFEENYGGEESCGIYAGNKSNLKVTESEFIKNMFGIFLVENSKTIILNSMFKENRKYGIYNRDESNIEISRTKFIKNKKGIVLNEKARAKASNSLFEENKISGISIYNESSFDISESNFIKNLYGVNLSENASTTILNSLFKENEKRGIDNASGKPSNLKTQNCQWI